MAVTECRKCVNSTLNPTVSIDSTGLCNVCRWFDEHHSESAIAREREWVETNLRSAGRMSRAVVGISGGKDSSATLAQAISIGGSISAFTVRSGYYPSHIESRSQEVAAAAGVSHTIHDFRSHIRDVDRMCYSDTADLFDLSDTPENREVLRNAYQSARAHYSVRCTHRMGFVRVCQLCRRSVVRAYYRVARQADAAFVFLGMNEWAGLSDSVAGATASTSAIRKLQPTASDEPVWVVHIPFLYGWRLEDTRRKLDEINWVAPQGEELVESNSNSCLLARATEAKARTMLGFSPDTMRLSREVTAGFLARGDAEFALSRPPAESESVRSVLERAGLQ